MVGNEPVEFIVDIVGSTTGDKYVGKFKVRPRLSHRDTLRRDIFRRELIGQQGGEAGPAAVQVAEIFSKVWVHLIDAPSWWKDAANGIDLLDEEPVVSVFEQIVGLEKKNVEAVKSAGDKAKAELATPAK